MALKINYKKLSLWVTALWLLLFALLSIWYLLSPKREILDVPVSASVTERSIDFSFRKKTYFDDPKPMPNVSFLSPDGKNVGWADFKGKYILVNFWATWCSPCVVELPTLQKLGEVFAERSLNVVAISMDMTGDQKRLSAFLEQRNISDFALYFDKDKEIQKNIPLRGLPTTMLLNPEGELLYIFEGEADWSAPPGIDFFDKLLP